MFNWRRNKFGVRGKDAKLVEESLRGYIDPKLVQYLAPGYVPPDRMPEWASFPYAIIQVAGETAEQIKDAIAAVLELSLSGGGVAREFVAASLVLFVFPRWVSEAPDPQTRCEQFVNDVRQRVEGRCRIVTGVIGGHHGCFSTSKAWYGLLCPGIEEIFLKLFAAEYGEVVRWNHERQFAS